MKNSDNEDRGEPIGALDKLISLAGKLSRKPFRRPSDDAVDAYLLGTATESQKAEVQAALRASSEFRKELLAMAEDLERLDDLETRKKADAMMVEPPPARAFEALKGTGAYHQREAREVGRRKEKSGGTGYGWVVPAMAAVCLVVAAGLLVMKYNLPEPNRNLPQVQADSTARDEENPKLLALSLVDPQVEVGLVAALDLRDISSTEIPGDSDFASEKEAAFAAFKKFITVDVASGYQLALRADSVISRLIDVPGEPLTIEFGSDRDEVTNVVMSRIPSRASFKAGVTVWVLDLERRSLYNASINGISCSVFRPSGTGQILAVALTYRTPSGFRSHPVGVDRRNGKANR